MSKPPKRVKIDLSAANHAFSAVYEIPPTCCRIFFSLPIRFAPAALLRYSPRRKTAGTTCFLANYEAVQRASEFNRKVSFARPSAPSQTGSSIDSAPLGKDKLAAIGSRAQPTRLLMIGFSEVHLKPDSLKRIRLTVCLRRALLLFALVLGASLLTGCGTTNQRTGTEQMLLSDAVDMSISRIDFRPLAGRRAYLDTTYIRPAPIPGMPMQLVNADYVVSGLRQALFAAHCELVDNKDEAEIIIEPRLGTLGNNGHEVVYGVPQTNALAQASMAFSGTSLLPPIPELSIGRSHAQFGLAKVAVFAYDKQTREPVWQSGIEKSESTAKNTWFVGAGPFQRGTIYEGYRFADSRAKGNSGINDPRQSVPYTQEHVFVPQPGSVQVAEEPAIPGSSGQLNPAQQR